VVIEQSAKRKRSIEKGTVLWRAQLGNNWRREKIRDRRGREVASFDYERPHSPKRMMPLQDRASEGRANPKGIPCLYFSTDRDTAMTETRPWIGSCVSVAKFVMLKDLTVVNCSAVEKDEPVWASINRAFSEPVTRNDDVADYAPTQVIAEALRAAGYDGIEYGSKLGTGKTVAIFDLAAAKPAKCHLYRVEAVSLKFSMVTEH